MNPVARCLCSTARLVARPTSRVVTVTTQQRSVHAFAPSLVLYKKRKGSAVSPAASQQQQEEDFEGEFEQDDFDDTVQDSEHDAQRYSGLTKGAGSAAEDSHGVSLLSRQERFARYYSVLDSALEKESTEFKSNIPSSSLLLNLIKTTGNNDVERMLDILTRWRKKGLPVKQETSDLLLRKLSKMEDRTSELLEVLSNGTKYGLQGLDARVLDKAFVRLTEAEKQQAAEATEEPASEGEASAALASNFEQASKLVQLERFYLDSLQAPRDAFGPLLTLAPTLISMNTTSSHQQQVKTLLDDVKSFGANGLAQFVQTLPPSLKDVVKRRLDTIVEELIKANSADARWFKQVITVLQA